MERLTYSNPNTHRSIDESESGKQGKECGVQTDAN